MADLVDPNYTYQTTSGAIGSPSLHDEATSQGLGSTSGAIGSDVNAGAQLGAGSNSAFTFQDLIDPLDLSGRRAAQKQYENQFSLDESARKFAAEEAQKQRDFEKMMSDTAIQRAAADYKAAGFNPWLAVQHGGVGATTPAGSAAQNNSGQANKADNKLAIALGVIATAIRIAIMKH